MRKAMRTVTVGLCVLDRGPVQGLEPTYETADAAAVDLSAAEDTWIPAEGFGLVRTGLIVRVPEGYHLEFTPRSSLAREKGLLLANSVGIIDQDYCGAADEIQISLFNPGRRSVFIQRGERLVQAQIRETIRMTCEPFTPEPASRGGFGSTGGYQQPNQ